MLGKTRCCATASDALVETMRLLAEHAPDHIPALAEAVRGRSRSLIARSVAEINPSRSDLARAAEFAPGWLISLNISNREKMGIIRTAADLMGLRITEDIAVDLPNA